MPYPHGVSVHVTMCIAPENVDKYFAAFKPVFEKVIAEPECLFFEVYQSPDQPGQITWVEDWSKSPDWFLNHQITKDYYEEYIAVSEPMFLKPVQVQFLARLGPEYCYNGKTE